MHGSPSSAFEQANGVLCGTVVYANPAGKDAVVSNTFQQELSLGQSDLIAVETAREKWGGVTITFLVTCTHARTQTVQATFEEVVRKCLHK